MDIDAASLAAAVLIGLLAAIGYVLFEWLKLRRSHVVHERQATLRAGLRAFLGASIGFTLIALYRLHTSEEERGMDIVLGLAILLVLAISLYVPWQWWRRRRAESPPARSTAGSGAAPGPRAASAGPSLDRPMIDDRRCIRCGIEKPSAEFPAPSVRYCNACGVMPCRGEHHDGELRPFAEFDDLSVAYCRRCAWKVCLQCGERKPFSDYIKGADQFCRACGLVVCRGCGKIKPVSEYAPGQEAGWFCRACGSAVCAVCGIKRPLRDFRDPAHEPACRDCEVRLLSEHERAVLEREEQDYRRRVKALRQTGHRPTEAEWDEASARRAALLGVSLRRYNQAAGDTYGPELLWSLIYLISAFLVGVFALVAGLTASPPELLPIALTIPLLCAWFLLWLALGKTLGDSQAYQDLSIRAELSSSVGFLFYLAPSLGALLLPVLSYMFVRIVLGS